MSELLPCPFCGGAADIDAPAGSRNDRLVYCKECFASICGDATPDAIAAWNRRPSPAAGWQRLSWDYAANCMRADPNGPFVCFSDVAAVYDGSKGEPE